MTISGHLAIVQGECAGQTDVAVPSNGPGAQYGEPPAVVVELTDPQVDSGSSAVLRERSGGDGVAE